jgi:hypothetical protein
MSMPYCVYKPKFALKYKFFSSEARKIAFYNSTRVVWIYWMASYGSSLNLEEKYILKRITA